MAGLTDSREGAGSTSARLGLQLHAALLLEGLVSGTCLPRLGSVLRWRRPLFADHQSVW